VLEEDITFTGGGSPVTYDVRLTVTNNNTGASAQETDQFVIKPYNKTDDRTPSNEVDYDKQQVTDSGNRYGRINVTPANPELVRTNTNGNPLFEFRAAKGAEIEDSASWYRVGSGNSSVGSGQVVTDKNGNVTGFFAEVQLDPKHVSNIQTRIKWTETVGYANQVRSHAFDFNLVAKIGAFVYTDENGGVYLDTDPDEDTAFYEIEYDIGNGFIDHVKGGSKVTLNSAQTGYNLTSEDDNLNLLSDGDQIKIKIIPFNSNDEEGNITKTSTFHQRNELVEHQTAATYPFSPPADQQLLKIPMHRKMEVQEVMVHATDPPNNNYTISVSFPDNTSYTITLQSENNFAIDNVTETIKRQEILKASCPSTTDDGLSDITISFDLKPVN
jgi:hypothetical protein